MTSERQLRESCARLKRYSKAPPPPANARPAAAAMERLRQALDATSKTKPVPEMKFSMLDRWQRRLFTALCRRYGLEPYRYKGQRYTTVMVRAPLSFVDLMLWLRT